MVSALVNDQQNSIVSYIQVKVTDPEIKEKLLENYAFDQYDLEAKNNIESVVEIMNLFFMHGMQVDEFLKGAHFVVEDNGELYHSRKLIGSERISSHYTDQKPHSDVGIRAGKTFVQVLMGTNGSHTWFQIENAPMPSLYSLMNNAEEIYNLISHSLDYIEYVSNGRNINIGQYGKSGYPDKNPLVLGEHYFDPDQCISHQEYLFGSYCY